LQLPQSIRNLTDDGALSFSVAIELARAYAPIKFEAERIVASDSNYMQNSEEANDAVERLIYFDMLRFISQFNINGQILAARSSIRSYANALRDKQRQSVSGQVQEAFSFLTESVIIHTSARVKQIRRHIDAYNSQKAQNREKLNEMVLQLMGRLGVNGLSPEMFPGIDEQLLKTTS
jgi:hypothetical protein